MKFILQTLSPLHIGSGVELEPFEYIVHAGTFYRVDTEKAFTLMYERRPDFPALFDRWLEKSQEALIREPDNAKQAGLREKFNLAEFCASELLDKGLAETLREKACHYAVPAPFGLQKRKKVGELARTATEEVYIPGSSIKGAIRTALLWRAFYRAPADEKLRLLIKVQSVMEQKIQRANRLVRRFGQLDKVFSEKFFFCGEKVGDRINYSNLQYDLMKFIRVTDAALHATGEESAVVLPVNLYLRNKPPQTQTNAYELITPNVQFSLNLMVATEVLREVYKKKGNTWIDLENRFKALFNVPLSDCKQPDFESRMLNSILSALADFSNALIKREADWLARYQEKGTDKTGKPFVSPSMRPVADFYTAISKSPYTLIRFGWGSGFLATTLFDALAGTPELTAAWKQVATWLKLGSTPRMNNDELEKYEYVPGKTFPSSKRMAAQANEAPIAPLGWAALAPQDSPVYKATEIPVAGAPVAAPVPPAEVLTRSAVMERNGKRKIKPGDTLEAEIISVEAGMVQVKLLLPDAGTPLSFKYANVDVFKGKKFVLVKVANIQKGVISNISYSGPLREEISE